MKISNDITYGLSESILASGYPMLDTPPTTSEFVIACNDITSDIYEYIYNQQEEPLNQRVKKAIKLGSCKGGQGHDNFLNGIVCQFDFEAPIKIWVEAQRYHFFDFVSSMSTMHRLKDFHLEGEAFDSYVDERIIEILNELQFEYSVSGDKEDLLKLLLNAPVGLNVCARMTTNYRQLKTMYNQRKNHRLPQWVIFCDWCDRLPLFNELTGCSREVSYEQ